MPVSRLFLPALLGLAVAACAADTAPTESAAGAGVPAAVAATVPSKSAAAPPPAHPPDKAASLLDHGIDVSVHSGAVDWSQVAAGGYGFAILKATEGVDLEDGAFVDHWLRVAEAGLVRGAYHFYVTEDDPQQQADFFTGKVHLQPGDLAPIVDIELVGHDTAEGWQQRLVDFVQRLHDHYRAAPIIYTSPKFWTDHFQGELAESLAQYPLWIAEYEVDQPAVPATWPTWHLWQYRGDAPTAGVEKGADLTRVNRAGVDPAILVIPESAARREPAPTP